MKNKASGKLWFKLFLGLSIFFLIFVLVLMLSNNVLLEKYYINTQKSTLIAQKSAVLSLDNAKTTQEMVDVLSDLYENHDIEGEIYTKNGMTVCTSYGGQILDYVYGGGRPGFKMQHRPLEIISTVQQPDGTVISEVFDNLSSRRYITYTVTGENYIIEIRSQIETLQNSAKIANRFIFFVAIFCLAGSVLGSFVFARKITKPISQMNEITRDMAALNFSRKINIDSSDEIGELGNSINYLSSTLDATLSDLREKNDKLQDEIDLERSLEAMRKGFVANVSHELKTPISIIGGYAEGLKQKGLPAAKKDEYCDIIIDESRRMNKLVLSILNLSKAQSGQLTQNLTVFDLGEFVKELASRVLRGTDYEIDTATVMVNADAMLTEQSVKSYLENALSHSEGKITVSVTADDTAATVTVHNQGQPIPPEIMPQIWQSFYRGDTSHKRDNTRFGLGLSIVSAITKLTGQTCGVYNTEDGVSFWLTVGLAKEDEIYDQNQETDEIQETNKE
ncbi:MAG: HAMP domain-containing histidine kinase [Oscillospiraceae bacterium]|nr:HAMP domain-containing histidine kinase [Candidatus Equicaccousia limihippi]